MSSHIDAPDSEIHLSKSSDDSDDWSLFAVGDYIYKNIPGRTLPIDADIANRIDETDIAIANVEAPMPGDRSSSAKVGPVLQSASDAPTALREAGFDAVTLANNHTMDQGDVGLTRTMEAYRATGLSSFGAGEDLDSALEPLRIDYNDTSIAVFGLCEREFGVARSNEPGTAWISHPLARRRVSKAAASTDVVIVITHGGIEYVPFPPAQRQRQLREFVDLGADLVIGHHPHVPQGWEIYRNSPIFYSLGNFLTDIQQPSTTEWGVALECTFGGASLETVELIVTEQADDTVQEMKRSRRLEAHLDYLHRISAVTGNRDSLRAHWQELAVRTFFRQGHIYHTPVHGFVTGPLPSLIHDPLRAASDAPPWHSDRKRTFAMGFLNIVRNESHRAVIETALAVHTDTIEDRRSSDVRERVDELLRWTEKPSQSTWSKLTTIIRSAIARARS